ncbi:MAG TPA: hypothetical protein VKE22_22405 [Haliangiales bacterium]|nr:hypothetical protein [Haliangiales bacterium]
MGELAELLAGWIRRVTPDGFALHGPRAGMGTVEVYARVPLRPLRRIAVELAAGATHGPRRELAFGPLAAFATAEGEHAGLVSVRGLDGAGRPCARTIALVAGDDWGAVVDGAADDAEHDAGVARIVRLMAEACPLRLGSPRRRRYLYRPPLGWQGLARPHAVRWLHPRFPRAPVAIYVGEADPFPPAPERSYFLEGAPVVPTEPDRPEVEIVTPRGLRGAIRSLRGEVDGTPATVLDCRLTHDGMCYPVTCVAAGGTIGDGAPTFAALVDSIVALPPRRAGEVVSDVWMG